MTREELLKKYLEERNIPITSLEANSILEGVEWADEHPKKGLISIDEMYSQLKEKLTDTFGAYEAYHFLKGFRKAMEG